MKSKTTKNINRVTGAVIAIAIRIIVTAVLVWVAVKGIGMSYDFGHSIFYAHAVEEEPGRDVRVSIPEGTDVQEAADILMNRGLIDNKTSFRVQAKFFEYEIMPGEYTLNTSETSREILEILNAGPTESEE